ncbi:MAG TPA: MgtC/SapB family protein [Anaerolineales bacterium]|nr:MgtC/SapB family protein [Anaerolineales bacterium]
MDELTLFVRFGTALAIGFFIGLQREFSHGGEGKTIPAGERTFALLALSGALGAMASEQFAQPLIFFGLLLAVGLLVVAGYVFKAQNGHFGMTTEAAILVTVLLGGLCYWNYVGLAIAIGVVTTVLLSIKWETDRLVEALTRQDVIAALQFAAITAIVLPLLPNRSLLPPPFDILNPFQVWLMVVFISGISFLGYVLIKLTGSQNGIGATGVLGGLVSSTAVTLSFARRSVKESKVVLALAVGISAAWAIMFGRIMFQIAVIHAALLSLAWLPLAASGLAGFVFAAYLIMSQRSAGRGRVEFSNPFDLGEALRFGVLYAFILVVARSAQLYLGDQGVLLSSFVSGLADVNAITISLAQLSRDGVVTLQVAAQGVVIAAITNTLFKGLLVFRLGSPSLRRALTPGLLAMLVVGVGVVLLI